MPDTSHLFSYSFSGPGFDTQYWLFLSISNHPLLQRKTLNQIATHNEHDRCQQPVFVQVDSISNYKKRWCSDQREQQNFVDE
jgi:hypothetical protein